jgi:hypothetical protein
MIRDWIPQSHNTIYKKLFLDLIILLFNYKHK